MFKKWLQKQRKLLSEHTHAERDLLTPELFHDPLAQEIDWNASRKGFQFYNPDSVKTRSGRLEFYRPKRLAMAFLSGGLGLSVLGVIGVWLHAYELGGACLLAGTLFALGGGWSRYRSRRPLVFDRPKGMVWKGSVPAREDLREDALPCAIEQIHALQLLSEVEVNEDEVREICFMRLVLKKGVCLPLLMNFERSALRQTAKELAASIGVPVWDAIGREVSPEAKALMDAETFCKELAVTPLVQGVRIAVPNPALEDEQHPRQLKRQGAASIRLRRILRKSVVLFMTLGCLAFLFFSFSSGGSRFVLGNILSTLMELFGLLAAIIAAGIVTVAILGESVIEIVEGTLTEKYLLFGAPIRTRSYELENFTDIRREKKVVRCAEEGGRPIQVGTRLSLAQAANLAVLLSDLKEFHWHLVTGVAFGDAPLPEDGGKTLLRNRDFSGLTAPLVHLNKVVIQAETCDLSQIEQFLAYVERCLTPSFLKHSVTGVLNGDPSALPLALQERLAATFPLVHDAECVIFGEAFPSADGAPALLRNPDATQFFFPMPALTRILIHAETYDFYRLERFLTYALEYIGQDALKQKVDVEIQGNPNLLHSNLYNNIVSLCHQVTP